VWPAAMFEKAPFRLSVRLRTTALLPTNNGDPADINAGTKEISQEEPPKFLGIKSQAIDRYEWDEMKHSIESAKKIAHPLKVFLDYLTSKGLHSKLDKKTQAPLGPRTPRREKEENTF
jgi:DNA-binding XRE family transcriptional regulator